MHNLEEILIKKSEQIAKLYGWTVVDVRVIGSKKKLTATIFLDKPGGITTNDCEEFSKMIEPYTEDIFSEIDMFYIEVSSPGIDRHLKKDREIKWAVGKAVRAVTNKEGKTVVYKGKLKKYKDNVLSIDDSAYGEVQLNIVDIKNIRIDSQL